MKPRCIEPLLNQQRPSILVASKQGEGDCGTWSALRLQTWNESKIIPPLEGHSDAETSPAAGREPRWRSAQEKWPWLSCVFMKGCGEYGRLLRYIQIAWSCISCQKLEGLVLIVWHRLFFFSLAVFIPNVAKWLINLPGTSSGNDHTCVL